MGSRGDTMTILISFFRREFYIFCYLIFTIRQHKLNALITLIFPRWPSKGYKLLAIIKFFANILELLILFYMIQYL